MIKCLTINQIELEFGNVGFWGEGKPENMEKNPWSQDKNQQQTQPTYDAKSGNQTWVTLVGGECSHHTVSSMLPQNSFCKTVLPFFRAFAEEDASWWKREVTRRETLKARIHACKPRTLVRCTPDCSKTARVCMYWQYYWSSQKKKRRLFCSLIWFSSGYIVI